MPCTQWRPWPYQGEVVFRRGKGKRLGSDLSQSIAQQVQQARSQGEKLQSISQRLGISLASAHKFAKGAA